MTAPAAPAAIPAAIPAAVPTDLPAHFAALCAAHPDKVDLRANLAHALQLAGRLPEAERHFEAVLAAAPLHRHALLNYCRMLEHGSDGLARIEAICDKALRLAPGDPIATLGLAKACLLGLRPAEGLALLERALQPPLGNGEVERELILTYLFYLGYSAEVSPQRFAQALRGAGRWLRQHFGPAAALLPAPDLAERQRPLRVGILCADVYHHPIGQLLASFIGEIDPARAEVTLYDLSAKSDDLSERLRATARHVPAAADSAAQLAARVRADSMDLVLDTANITHPVILGALALRCAPVQLSWAGWVYGHPLDSVDGFIADVHTVPDAAAAAQFPQPVLRLPACVYAYRPQGERPAPAPLPALANGYVTFGAYNHLAKVNEATLDLWAAVLHGVPDSRLAIKAATVADTATRDRLAVALARRGIAPQRLLMGLPSAYEDFLEDFARVDILLDCLPFNGGMTTIDSLWQGVPLLALAGPSHASRVGMSLMRAAGLPEWVVEVAGESGAEADDTPGDELGNESAGESAGQSAGKSAEKSGDIAGQYSGDAYVALAQRMCADLPALAALRADLPRRLAASPLGDVKAFAEAMLHLWENAVAG